jgi:hydrogenase/urease accessory protein HupE
VLRFFAALFSIAFVLSANAHLISAGNGLVNVLPERAVLLVAVPVSVLQNVDTNQDGLLQPEEIKLNRERIIAQLSQSIDFQIGASRGEVLDDQIMVSVHADGSQATPQIEWLRQLKFSQDQLDLPVRIAFKDRLLLNAYLIQVKRADGQELAILNSTHPAHIFFNNSWGTVESFFLEGWQHIVQGHDHLVFLVTLLAAGIVWRRWFYLLTAFTLAHGITYGLASMGWVQVKPELIEPVIALSILLTALASLLRLKISGLTEAALVFCFGLFHGLGFASAMSAQLQGQKFPISAIVGFNLGIEAGQLLVCLVLGIVFEMLKRSPQWLEKIRIWILWSGLVAGGFWLVQSALSEWPAQGKNSEPMQKSERSQNPAEANQTTTQNATPTVPALMPGADPFKAHIEKNGLALNHVPNAAPPVTPPSSPTAAPSQAANQAGADPFKAFLEKQKQQSKDAGISPFGK